MAEAAYCSECRGYVWLDASGGCSNGHPRSCLRDVHPAAELPTPIGVPPAEPASSAPPVAAAAAAGVAAPVSASPSSPGQEAPYSAPQPVQPTHDGYPGQQAPQPDQGGYPAQGIPPADPSFSAQGDPLSGAVADPHGYYMPPHAPVNAANTGNIAVRLVAYVIDFLIVMAIQTVVGGTVGAAVGFMAGASGQDPAAIGGGFGFNVALWLIGFSITVGYFTILEAVFGFTAGKRIFGLRVVNENAERISWGQSVARNLMRFVDLLFWGLVGIISMNSSELHQRLGDRVANTYVVR